MKKFLLLVLLLTICAPTVFAFTYTATNEKGEVIRDIACDSTKSDGYFICQDNLTGGEYKQPRHTRKVEDVYINGQHKRVVKEQYGDKVYIKY